MFRFDVERGRSPLRNPHVAGVESGVTVERAPHVSPFKTAHPGALVLIIEDDGVLADTLALILRGAGFRTERASDGRAALSVWRASKPDLVLLDLGLPELDGREVLKMIRGSSNVPVVILTARAEESDELDGLGLGADGYLVKPVTREKLLAHLEAILRRVKAKDVDGELIRVGDVEIDFYRVEARVGTQRIPLTPTEFQLLAHVARTPGRAIDRNELYEVALPDRDAYDRAVDVHVANLRRKLREATESVSIETVRGVGYRLSVGLK